MINFFGSDSPPLAAVSSTVPKEPLREAANTPPLGAGKFITVEHYGGKVHQTDIQAYRIKGDPLTGAQEAGWTGTAIAAGVGYAIGGAKGATIGALARMGFAALLPDAVGTPRELEGKGMNPISLHSMEQVIASIEDQTSEDQQKLESATEKSCP